MASDPATPPPAASLPALRLLERHSPHEIADAIEIMLDFLDVLGGEADLEEPGLEDSFMDHAADGPGCSVADAGGPSWTEWQTRGRHKLSRGGTEKASRRDDIPDQHEDDEDDDPDTGIEDDPLGCDPEEDRCLAGDDMIRSGAIIATGIYGFNYAATGGREIGDAEDAEREGMIHDVPTLPVYSLEPNAFTGNREFLGRSNLLTSFRTNGHDCRSADSGRVLKTTGWVDKDKPGEPV